MLCKVFEAQGVAISILIHMLVVDPSTMVLWPAVAVDRVSAK